MAASSPRSVRQRQRSTLCIFSNKGWCKSGVNCRFTHGTSDKREVLAYGARVTGGEKEGAASVAELCNFFARGACSGGEKCAFLHSTTATAHGNRLETSADGRSAKRPASEALVSPRPPPRRRPAAEPAVSCSSVDGSGGGGGGSRGAGTWDSEPEASWEPSPNAGGVCFLSSRGGSGGPTPTAVMPPTASRMGGSWRDAATRSTDPLPDSAIAAGSLPAPSSPSGISALALIASIGAESAAWESPVGSPAARSVEIVAAAVNSALAAPRARPRKTCPFFARGCCRFGDHCRNVHGAEPTRGVYEETKVSVEMQEEGTGEGEDWDEETKVSAEMQEEGTGEGEDRDEETADRAKITSALSAGHRRTSLCRA